MDSAQLAVFHGPGQPFEFRSVPEPSPGPGEVVVALSLATLCGSDLHTVDGRRREPTPAVLGHEAVGRVCAAGPGREGLMGRRVTWTLTDSCGACRPCIRWDLPQKCDALFKYGHASLESGTGFNGCYASHIVLRAGTTVLPLPDSVSDRMAAPANCALATMVAAVGAFDRIGEVAVVQGAGLLGLYGCALLRRSGWRRVIVIEKHASRLELVEAFGGEPYESGRTDEIPAASVDGVIEATGQPAVVPDGIRMLRPGGTYVWVGMVHPESQLNLTGESVIRRCLTVRGVHNYAPRHLRTAIDFLETHAATHPWDRLVSPPLPLDSLENAFALARTGRWPRVSVRAVSGS